METLLTGFVEPAVGSVGQVELDGPVPDFLADWPEAGRLPVTVAPSLCAP